VTNQNLATILATVYHHLHHNEQRTNTASGQRGYIMFYVLVMKSDLMTPLMTSPESGIFDNSQPKKQLQIKLWQFIGLPAASHCRPSDKTDNSVIL